MSNWRHGGVGEEVRKRGVWSRGTRIVRRRTRMRSEKFSPRMKKEEKRLRVRWEQWDEENESTRRSENMNEQRQRNSGSSYGVEHAGRTQTFDQFFVLSKWIWWNIVPLRESAKELLRSVRHVTSTLIFALDWHADKKKAVKSKRRNLLDWHSNFKYPTSSIELRVSNFEIRKSRSSCTSWLFHIFIFSMVRNWRLIQLLKLSLDCIECLFWSVDVGFSGSNGYF